MILTYSIIFNGLHHLKHHNYAEFILQNFDCWIMVEGAAKNLGSTRWYRPMPARFHRRDHSADGTLQFLEKVGRRYDNLRLLKT